MQRARGLLWLAVGAAMAVAGTAAALDRTGTEEAAPARIYDTGGHASGVLTVTARIEPYAIIDQATWAVRTTNSRPEPLRTIRDGVITISF